MRLRSHTIPLSTQQALQKRGKCHYCRGREPNVNHLICVNYPECKHSFCYQCLKNCFAIVPTRPKFDSWVCLVCRGVCNCSRCQERLKEDINKMKFDNTLQENQVTDDTLIIKEWRKESYLSNEGVFKGPKTYVRRCKTPPEKSIEPAKQSDTSSKVFSGSSDYLPSAQSDKHTRHRRKIATRKTSLFKREAENAPAKKAKIVSADNSQPKAASKFIDRRGSRVSENNESREKVESTFLIT